MLTFVIPFITLMPITIFLTFSPKYYPILYWFLHNISKFMLYASGIFPKIYNEGFLDPNKQYIFCANHASTLDIPFMFFLNKKPISFIGKNSLGNIPIFGYYYKTFNILVNRKSLRDSYSAYEQAGLKLKEGQNLVIYPEGGIPKQEIRLNKFKNGLFRLAIEESVSIVPITFADNKKIFPADSYYEGKPGKARVTIHNPVSVGGMKKDDAELLKSQLYKIINTELIKYENESK